MSKEKQEFTKVTAGFKKEAKVMLRLPRDKMPEIKQLIAEHELKGIQDLFDALIVSGVVFRRAEILDFIRLHKKKYQDNFREQSLAKLKKDKTRKTKYQDYYSVNMFMYEADKKALEDFLVEESDLRKQWVYNILIIDGFCAKEPVVIDLVSRYRDLEIGRRKKAVARLANDEYVEMLPLKDSQNLLQILTKEYDEKKFSESIEKSLFEILGPEQQRLQQEEAEEEEFEKKISTLRQMRGQELNKVVEEKLDNLLENTND